MTHKNMYTVWVLDETPDKYWTKHESLVGARLAAAKVRDRFKHEAVVTDAFGQTVARYPKQSSGEGA